jgi:uncharacterized protein (DUF1330 family)
VEENAMPAYVLGLTELSNPTPMDEYVPKAVAIIAQYGGRVVAAGPLADVLETGIGPDTAVLIEFDSVDAARRWYDSQEYGSVRGLRHSAGRTTLIVMDGL